MIHGLRRWLTEPAVRGLDPDSSELALAHRQVLRRKPMVRRLFERFYRQCRQLDDLHFGNCPGLRIEMGSGSSLFQELYPDVWCIDVKALPFVDLAARAEALPVSFRSVRALYAINVFHHLPEPRSFFEELLRVLHPGGGVIMIEPHYGPLARVLFKRMHASEGFDTTVVGWDTPGSRGPMSNANQALSYVVFVRDRAIFEREFPELEVVADQPHTPLAYVLSGGVNFRQLVPDWSMPGVELAERLLAPLDPLLGIQHTILLRRKS